MGVFRSNKLKGNDYKSQANLPLSPRESTSTDVPKKVSLMETCELANSINIHKVRSSFYNFDRHNSSTLSSTQNYPITCIAKLGGSKMKFVKTSAMMPLLKSMSTDRDTSELS